MAEDLTKLTVNLVPDAVEALAKAAELEQLSKTDVVNRALQLYASILGEAVPEMRMVRWPRADGVDLAVVIRPAGVTR